MYYMVDNQVAHLAQAMKVKNQVNVFTHVSLPDQALVTFLNKGIERRHPSWLQKQAKLGTFTSTSSRLTTVWNQLGSRTNTPNICLGDKDKHFCHPSAR
jgi:hypothetical protein